MDKPAALVDVSPELLPRDRPRCGNGGRPSTNGALDCAGCWLVTVLVRSGPRAFDRELLELLLL